MKVQGIMKPQTGFVCHELSFWHDTGTWAGFMAPGFPVQPFEHAEHPETKRRIKNLLEASGYIKYLKAMDPREATEEELERFHTRAYIERVKELSGAKSCFLSDVGSGALVGKGSFEIAKLAAGGLIRAVDAVIAGEIANAYCLHRPPGHHALSDRGMGFCIFGNIAIAVHHALACRNLRRVAVVDWDAHHGNGTQDAFYQDSRVLTISVHQDRCFPPDTGFAEERGSGDGFGYNINVPLPAGSSVGAYTAVFDRIVVPALREFEPELVVVACGFDAGAFDPMARLMMTTQGFRSIGKKTFDAAKLLCGGRVVVCHEGGYHAPTVPFFALAMLEELTGIESGVADPFEAVFNATQPQELLPHQEEVIKKVEALVLPLGRK